VAYELASREARIPPYYFGQLQHILMVMRANRLIYATYRPRRPIVEIEVTRDDNYIRTLRTAEHSFAALLSERGHQMEVQFRGIGYTRHGL
jgi:hypothetical protein